MFRSYMTESCVQVIYSNNLGGQVTPVMCAALLYYKHMFGARRDRKGAETQSVHFEHM